MRNVLLRLRQCSQKGSGSLWPVKLDLDCTKSGGLNRNWPWLGRELCHTWASRRGHQWPGMDHWWPQPPRLGGPNWPSAPVARSGRNHWFPTWHCTKIDIKSLFRRYSVNSDSKTSKHTCYVKSKVRTRLTPVWEMCQKNTYLPMMCLRMLKASRIWD